MLMPPVTCSTILLLVAPVASLTSPLPLPRAMLKLLSQFLPHVPGKVVTKIQVGKFINLRELLLNNVALQQHIEESQLAGLPLPMDGDEPPATPDAQYIHSTAVDTVC